MLSEADLQREAAATGFRVEALEKVVRLLELLEGFRSHPFLKPRLVLKGGTAINLFVFDVPRVTQVPMLDVHEVAAGKLGALFGRAASRDLRRTGVGGNAL